ncbi:hypothetical protein COT82_01950 [Candidatus Campbellbacteria bacterium CG10_big_fil_rev_8_21_14_0_10_35_52]|uniref:Pseudouridine synthase n=1 Tax=Candidatus Campbellbacteria bacterium CG10_big_fil_rev_8_21_14_0_10_35_52 TaxID=1974527 RepID=A0A2M6WV89_9BACT|nr:MAG: hypothetical protein COT82_01950 [Candidatus Campbellbacteria bacterium CG10_big_fil_rev_8_21_14_0_10_35_52]
MKIQILYENNEVIVVNKPAGLLTHNDGKDKNKTLTDWALERYPKIKNVGEPSRYRGNEIARHGIAHRLDRETSGVIVLAKTQESFLNLKKQFQERKITKIYNAFVYGEIKKEKDIINRPIGKSKSDFRKWSAQRGARGDLREAITYYKVLKKNKDFSYVEVSPKTGRTHQIRVHFKAINHPVVCDKLYAPKHICGLGFERLALHAKSLEFSLINGEVIFAESELPKDFKYALTLLT